MRTTNGLNLGNMLTTSINDGNSQDIDLSLYDSAKITLNGSMATWTITFSNIAVGSRLTLWTEGGNDGMSTLNLPAVKWDSGTQPMPIGAIDLYNFFSTGTTAGSMIGCRDVTGAS